MSISQVNGVNIVANRWYMVETAYARGAGTNGGTLSATVIGNRGNGALTGTTPSTANLTAGSMLLADAAGPTVGDEQLESLLLNRLEGPFVDFDAADFQRMRERFKNQLDQNQDDGDRAEPGR